MNNDLQLKNINEKELKRRNFILNGNLFKVIFVIGAPLFFYSIFSYIYSIIDTIMCSGISKDAVNAVGALSQATNMISALGGGLAAGGSILISRQIGRKDYERAKKLATTIFTYTLLIGIITCLIIIPLSGTLLKLIQIDESLIEVGKEYFMISVATAAIIMFNTVYMGVEKSRGSTLPITILNFGVIIVKVILNYLFIYVFSLKEMKYVSLSTLIANSILFLFIIYRLLSKNYIFNYRIKNLDLSFKTLRTTTNTSFPIFLGKFIFSLGKVVINALASSYGNDVVGALGVSNNMGGSITNPLSSVEDTSSSVISQNIGNKNINRAIKTFFVALVYALSIAVVGVIIITIFDSEICHFFARNAGSEEEIEEFASNISSVFRYEKIGIITLAINSCILGLFYGFNLTKISSAINIARVFVFRIPTFLICKYVIKLEDGFLTAGISMGVSNILIGVMSSIIVIVVILKIKKKMRIKEESKMLNEEEIKKVNSFCDEFLKNYKPYKEKKNFCYEDGVVLNGAYQLYKATRKKDYLSFCYSYYDENISSLGALNNFNVQNFNLDDLEAGYTLFKLNALKHSKKYQNALDMLEFQFNIQPRLDNGSFFHKERYPYQLWLDGIYMAMPFYSLVASKHHSLKMYKDIVKQFENVEKYNLGDDGFYYHAYDEKKVMQRADKKTGRSPNVWLRSVGWLAMADVDCYEIFKENKALVSKKIFKKQLLNIFKSLEPYIDKQTNMLKDLPLIDNEKNYFETSGSLMLAYAYLKAARIGLIPYEETKKGSKIFEGVVKNYLKEDGLNNICRVSGLDNERRDGSVEYYLSEEIIKNDSKGVGPFMMAYSEYLLTPINK